MWQSHCKLEIYPQFCPYWSWCPMTNQILIWNNDPSTFPNETSMRRKRLRGRHAWCDQQPGCFPWLRMLRGKGLFPTNNVVKTNYFQNSLVSRSLGISELMKQPWFCQLTRICMSKEIIELLWLLPYFCWIKCTEHLYSNFFFRPGICRGCSHEFTLKLLPPQTVCLR